MKSIRNVQIEFMEQVYEKFLKRAKEKNRALAPWKDFDINDLLSGFQSEVKELIDSFVVEDYENLMEECKDVANFAWFIYEWSKLKINKKKN